MTCRFKTILLFLFFPFRNVGFGGRAAARRPLLPGNGRPDSYHRPPQLRPGVGATDGHSGPGNRRSQGEFKIWLLHLRIFVPLFRFKHYAELMKFGTGVQDREVCDRMVCLRFCYYICEYSFLYLDLNTMQNCLSNKRNSVLFSSVVIDSDLVCRILH